MSHPRFEGSRRGTLTTPAGAEVRAVLAEGFGLRFKGLMQVPADELEPLLFPNCRSLHMYWMKTAIDVVWVELDLDEGTARILGVDSELPPRRNASAPKGLGRDVRKRVGALELAPGTATALELESGQVLSVRVESGTKG